MNKEILQEEIQDYIHEFTGDINSLAFSGSPFPNVSTQELLMQISSRNQIKNKLPLWYKTKGIYYPPKLNLEQTSSEITAQHKAQYIKGDNLIDLTGGFGIDTYYFAHKTKQVWHAEMDAELSQIASHNAKVLGVENIEFYVGNSLELLNREFDTIYADPARRDDAKNKVFLLEDCLPNIPLHLETILSHTKLFMMKSSPMLDISQGIRELEAVYEIHIVAIDNEVKELLWFMSRDVKIDSPKLISFNYTKSGIQVFESNLEDAVSATYSEPLEYLYEPNAAILKSGAFNQVSEQLGINKLALHSHLYTSEELIDFPGRRFKIAQVLPYNKKEMKRLGIKKANISIRNFKESVATLRKKWKIKDGGDIYLFFTTNQLKEQVVLVCSAITH